MSTHAVAGKKGVSIEILSILWMIVEAGVAIGAGLTAHSLALVAFGADSIIELISGSVLLWRLTIEANGASLERVKRAEKASSWVVGIALLLLAVYIILASMDKLWTHLGAEFSYLGIGLAIVLVSSCLICHEQRNVLELKLAARLSEQIDLAASSVRTWLGPFLQVLF